MDSEGLVDRGEGLRHSMSRQTWWAVWSVLILSGGVVGVGLALLPVRDRIPEMAAAYLSADGVLNRPDVEALKRLPMLLVSLGLLGVGGGLSIRCAGVFSRLWQRIQGLERYAEHRAMVHLISIALLSVVAAVPTWDNYFEGDDFNWIEAAQAAQQHMGSVFTARIVGFFRPTAHLLFLVLYVLFGLHPLGYHVVLTVLHGTNAILAYSLALRLTKDRSIGLGAGLLFAVHASHSEAIQGIASISGPLGTMFYLTSLYAFFVYLKGRKVGYYVLSLLCAVWALGSKESCVTLIPVIGLTGLLFDDTLRGSAGARGGRGRMAYAWKVYTPFAILLSAYLSYEYVIQQQSGLVQQGLYALRPRFVYSLGKYLATLCVPYVDLFLDVLLPMSVLLCVGLVVLGIYLTIRASGPMRFLLGWLLISILPISFFTGRVASRYCYLPSVPFSIGVGVLIVRRWRTMGRRLTTHAAYLLMVGYFLSGHLALTYFNEIRFDVRSTRTEHFIRQMVPLLSALQTGDQVYVIRSPLDEAHLQAALRVITGNTGLIAHGIQEDRMREQERTSIPSAREGLYVFEVEGDRVYRRQ